MVTPSQKAKLIWSCRRGMLELDLILNAFVSKHLDHLNESQLTAFETLLEAQDPDLLEWLMGNSSPEQPALADLVSYIRLHHRA